MSPTLHRPTSRSGDTHHRFDFLHGIDLEREHVRRSSSRTPWIVGAVVLLLVLAVIGLVLVMAPPTTPDPAVEPAALSLHDSGIEQALQARQLTLDAGIAQAHDSGIALAIRDRNVAFNQMHDSGIDYLLRNP
jgi:hypothetical protein